MLPNSTMLFILRDPIKRLISDYRFHLQRNHPSTRGTLEYFFEWQRHMRDDIPNLLKFGCYLEYLQPFIEIFGRSRVLVLFFGDFFANPVVEMEKLCARLGIDKTFYQTYAFDTHNPTINFKSIWLNNLYMSLEPAVASLRTKVVHFPKLHKAFEELMMIAKSTYRKLNNNRGRKPENFPPEVIAMLKEYYQPHNTALSDELGCSLPWNSRHD